MKTIGLNYKYLYDYFKSGDDIICLTDHGWSPGCVTVGKIYQVEGVYDDHMNIYGDNGALYRTDARCFQNYAEYLAEKRDDKINSILSEENSI